METDICTQCGEPYFMRHLHDGVCITCKANMKSLEITLRLDTSTGDTEFLRHVWRGLIDSMEETVADISVMTDNNVTIHVGHIATERIGGGA